LPGFLEDPRRWTLKHDVSTLGGNSGSPVLSLTGGMPHVVGLHFGGKSRVANFGHILEQLSQQLQQLNVRLIAS
jgi:V8-like Glu-specific endopeptidase